MSGSLRPQAIRSSSAGSPPVSSISTVQPRFLAAAMTSAASSAKYGATSSGTASAMMPLRPVRKWRAEALGW